jgi:hypothetical protein
VYQLNAARHVSATIDQVTDKNEFVDRFVTRH